MNQDKSAVLEKIRKLLAVARDGRGNENEAAAAARQAEALMRRHQIQNAELTLGELRRGENFSRNLARTSYENIKGHRPKVCPSWVGFIGVGVGTLCSCKVDLVNTPDGLRMRFSGYDADAVMAVWLHEFLCETVFRLSREYGKAASTDASSAQSAPKSFRVGAAGRIADRLKMLARERTSQPARGTVEEQALAKTALIIVSTKLQAVQERFGETKTKETKVRPSDGAAYGAGRAAGDRVHIPTNRPLGGAGDAGRLT